MATFVQFCRMRISTVDFSECPERRSQQQILARNVCQRRDVHIWLVTAEDSRFNLAEWPPWSARYLLFWLVWSYAPHWLEQRVLDLSTLVSSFLTKNYHFFNFHKFPQTFINLALFIAKPFRLIWPIHLRCGSFRISETLTSTSYSRTLKTYPKLIIVFDDNRSILFNFRAISNTVIIDVCFKTNSRQK